MCVFVTQRVCMAVSLASLHVRLVIIPSCHLHKAYWSGRMEPLWGFFPPLKWITNVWINERRKLWPKRRSHEDGSVSCWVIYLRALNANEEPPIVEEGRKEKLEYQHDAFTRRQSVYVTRFSFTFISDWRWVHKGATFALCASLAPKCWLKYAKCSMSKVRDREMFSSRSNSTQLCRDKQLSPVFDLSCRSVLSWLVLSPPSLFSWERSRSEADLHKMDESASREGLCRFIC